MNKFLIASASSLALLALAACSDTDDTQTQSIDEPPLEEQQPAEPMDPAPEPVRPAPSE